MKYRPLIQTYRAIMAKRPRFLISGINRLTNWLLKIKSLSLENRAAPGSLHKATGSDAPPFLLVKNLLHPDRFIKKLAYGQIVRLPSPFLLSEALAKDCPQTDEVIEMSREIKKNGFVLLPGYFKGVIGNIAERYFATPATNMSTKEVTIRFISLLDPSFIQFALNEKILALVGHYFGYQPLIQDFPIISIVDTLRTDASSSNEQKVMEWHGDNVNTVKAFIFLTNINTTQTRMLLARGSHLKHRVSLTLSDSQYADDYVRRHYDVVDCVGPKGTLLIFDTNALHRQCRVLRSFRSMIAVKYSTGNGLNFYDRSEKPRFELPGIGRVGALFRDEPLSQLQRCALKGLVETSPPKI